MSPIGWAVRPLKRYAEFRGRSPRAEFWWFFLFVFIVYIAMWLMLAGSIGSMAASDQQDPASAMMGVFGGAGLLMVVFWLAILIPSIAVQVRRLHDQNRSGWWIGAFYLLYLAYIVMLFGTMGSMAGNPEAAEGSMGLVAGVGIFALAMLVYMIVLLVFYCMPGTRGPNRFGEDPYGQDVEQVFA
jgi:uncharacterized membrane protein YhaH (DUF805 family)